MSVTEFQQRILDLQKSIAELQTEAEANAPNPNADELLLAYLDAGQKAIDAVRRLLHKIG